MLEENRLHVGGSFHFPWARAGREFLLLEVPDTSNIAPTQEQLRLS